MGVEEVWEGGGAVIRGSGVMMVGKGADVEEMG